MASETTCTLCELPIADTAVESADGEQFCCRGCREIHTELSTDEDLSVEAAPGTVKQTSTAVPDDHERTFLQIDGMHCSTCETFIERRAKRTDGVSRVDASYITETVRIDHDPAVSPDSLTDLLTGLGYRATLRDEETDSSQQRFMRLIVGAVFGMMVMLNYVALIYPTYFEGGLYYPAEIAAFLEEMIGSTAASPLFIMLGILTSVVLFYTGSPLLKGAYVSLRMRRPNMDLLIAVAALSAWTYSTVGIFVGAEHAYYDVSVSVIMVVTAGGYYESQIKQRATDRLADLTEIQVETARRYTADGSTETVSIEELSPGDTVLVASGERVPVDGRVEDGNAQVDEAVVTGESRPVAKTPGQEVIGGSLVQDGALDVAIEDDTRSSIQRITDVVWDLQSATHGIQRLADRLATVFVPAVLALAVTVGAAGLAAGRGPTQALLVALTVLIVSCPCALGLATPLAIASSIRDALDQGIVVFDETVFERLGGVDTVVFDKTGTLTTGEMRVIDATGPSALLETAGLLEQRSSHPVAEPITAAFGPGEQTVTADGGTDDTGVEMAADENPEKPESITAFQTHPKGVSGRVGGRRVLAGHPDLFDSEGWTVPAEIESRAQQAHTEGHVPVVVGEAGTAGGIIVVGDQPREEFEEVVSALADRGIEIAVLTGDDRRAATQFEEHPAIDTVFAGVPPEAKAETVNRLRADGQTVMVGDGTNDAPALATADLGIALGSGTALAADAADIAIVTDDLRTLETSFDLAAAANSRVRQNIGWAFCYNAVAIPLAVAGKINPLFAALAMATSSLLVVANSSRPLLES